MFVVYGVKLSFLQLLCLLADKTLNEQQAVEYIKERYQCSSYGLLLVRLDTLIDVLRYYKISEWLQDDGMMKLINPEHPRYSELMNIWKVNVWQSGLSSGFKLVDEMQNVIIGARLIGVGCCDLETLRNAKLEQLISMLKMLGLVGNMSYYCVW